MVRQLSPSATGDVAAGAARGDRLAARQRRGPRTGDLGHRLQQHLEVDQHRAAPRRDDVLHVEIAAAQHVGQADEAAGEREVARDLGQAGAGFLLDELDPPVVAAIEDPQRQAGEAARDGRARRRPAAPAPHPGQQPAVGGVEGEAARLVDDAEAGGERQRGDPAAAVVRVGQRRLDVDDQAGLGAVAERPASASRSMTMREASSAVALTQRPMITATGAPAPGSAEQRHQAVGELAADEGLVAAALGGPERLQLVEQRELRRPGQRAEQMPLDPRHRLRRENRRRVLAGEGPARHPQHRHQEVEERRQLGVAGSRRATRRAGAGATLGIGESRRSASGPASMSETAWRAAPAMASMWTSQSGSTIATGGCDSARATSVIDRSSQVRRRSKASGSPGEKA